jgi:hypothetical protein
MVVVLYWMARHSVPTFLFALCIVPFLMLAFFSLPFLGPKIAAEFGSGYSSQITWSLSRYASFQLDMDEFVRKPLLGAGIFDEARPDRKSTRLNSSHRLTSRMPSSA